jgi:hypothetical protein
MGKDLHLGPAPTPTSRTAISRSAEAGGRCALCELEHLLEQTLGVDVPTDRLAQTRKAAIGGHYTVLRVEFG